jgi:hypothetical protein
MTMTIGIIIMSIVRSLPGVLNVSDATDPCAFSAGFVYCLPTTMSSQIHQVIPEE